MIELTCPYCNAVFPGSPQLTAGEMTTCPRCEERFKVLASSITSEASGAVDRGVDTPRSPGPGRRLSNRTIALGVVGVMAIMAAIAWKFALMTQDQRRENDTGLRQSTSRKRPRQLDVPDAAPLAPLEMDALKYVPSDVDVLAGVHVREILQNAEAKRFLQREVAWLKGSVEDRLLSRIEKLTGIPLGDIDHVVLGARLTDTSLMLAVRTRWDYDADRVLASLGAKELPGSRNEKIYRFRQELLPTHGQGLVHCLNPRTLLLTWAGNKEDISPGHAQERKPRPELEALLRQRVKPAGPIWVAGTFDPKQVQAVGLLLGLARIPEAERKLLLRLRSFGVWVTLEEKLTVRAVVQGTDAGGGEAVEEYLRRTLGDEKGVTILRDDEWVTLQLRR